MDPVRDRIKAKLRKEAGLFSLAGKGIGLVGQAVRGMGAASRVGSLAARTGRLPQAAKFAGGMMNPVGKINMGARALTSGPANMQNMGRISNTIA